MNATWRGIIPARAGFTGADGEECVGQGDHPRSRGVYPQCSDPLTSSSGSSPLARGLPPETIYDDLTAADHPRSRGVYASQQDPAPLRPRIIPARAGFTPRVLARSWRGRDHPRSRGVYCLLTVEITGVLGSSPLARGLQPLFGLDPSSPGIIPARAGFTTGFPTTRN